MKFPYISATRVIRTFLFVIRITRVADILELLNILDFYFNDKFYNYCIVILYNFLLKLKALNNNKNDFKIFD